MTYHPASDPPSPCYRVQTRRDYLDGVPFPWEDSCLSWNCVEAAREEMECAVAAQDAGDGVKFEARIVRVTVEVVEVGQGEGPTP